jgi:hypothetical protein
MDMSGLFHFLMALPAGEIILGTLWIGLWLAPNCSCYSNPEQTSSSTFCGEQFSPHTLQNFVYQRQHRFCQRNRAKSQALLLWEQKPFKGNTVQLYRSKLQDNRELTHI